MVSATDMVIGSFSKIWHIIPIVIAIIFLKKYINKKDKDRQINKNEENEKNGLTLELRTINKYKESGYKVIEDSTKDQGVDLLCSKDDKTLLFKCNNSSESKSITGEDIKTFHRDAIKYVKANDIEKNGVEFRYVVPYTDVLDKSAIKILEDDGYNCKYMVL